MDLFASSLVFSISMCFWCSCLSALPCSTVGIIVLLPFTAMQSMIAVSTLNDQYGSRSFCTSALVDGKLWSMRSESMLTCLSSSVAIPISFAVMQSSMSVHDIVALMVTQMPGILSSHFGFWLCLDSQPVMNRCCSVLYGILMWYWCILNSIAWCMCDRLAISFLNITTSGLWSVITLT